jgi:uncharacterized protein
MANSGRPRKCDPKVRNLRSNIRLREYDIAKATLSQFGIDVVDGEGRTAFINAVIENNKDFIYWLLDNGANINHQDRIGYSALHFACESHQIELCNILLDKGANPNLQDIHGNTPLWTAVFNSKGLKELLILLLKSNANPDIINNYQRSPRIMYETFYKENINLLIN